MGELVLSSHLPALNGASSFSACKVLLQHRLDSRRRRWCAIAGNTRNSGFSSNLEGYSDCSFHGSVDNHHPHQQNYQQHLHLDHHQHHAFHHHGLSQPWKGSLDVGWHSGRLGLGFSVATERESADAEMCEHGHFANSFSHNTECSSNLREEPIAVHHACAGGLIAAGVDIPFSLRMLKRKQQGFGKSTLPSGLSEVGNSLLNAFFSVVHMMKALQSHTLHIGQEFFAQDIEGLLSKVHQEMHVSFVWLFQQVFSCTPELMMLIMVLLADFTAFSVASNIPLLPISVYNPRSVSMVSALSNCVNSSDGGFRAYLSKTFEASPSVVDRADDTYSDGGYVGNGGRRIDHIEGGDGEDPDFMNVSMNLNKALYAVDDNLSTEFSSKAAVSVSSLYKHSKSQAELPPNDFMSATEDLLPSEFSDMAAALAFQELMAGEASSPTDSNDVGQYAGDVETKEELGTQSYLSLDQETMQSLIAPVSTKVEDDDYSCYDRTDLAYQVAIKKDSKNPMLLANYAQFLFLVRKDHDRAEELFRKAVQCNPFDCDAMSRFATFLWLARHNLVGAERAYQAALRVDPINSFHAANYAHFLWNSGQ